MTAYLRHVSNQRISVLRAEHLVGRSARCDLSINADHISVQHAAVRWNGETWEVRDLGSRNGTWIDGAAIRQGEARVIRAGMTIMLGEEKELWQLVDDSPPETMAISLDTEEVVLPENEILALPSIQLPEVVLYRGADGQWEREEADGSLTLAKDQDRFTHAGRRWLFCCPYVVTKTTSLEERPTARAIRLELRVSLDEENVSATVRLPNREMSLGVRAHHYVLLTLARHRLKDQAAGLVPSSCGWVYVEDLLEQLRVSPEQLNVDVFRIRQQFGSVGLARPADVIERRPRTRQLRVAIPDLVIHRL